MYWDNKERKLIKRKINQNGFRQTHGGRDQFPSGEWGTSGEFAPRRDYHESDSYDRFLEGIDVERSSRDDDLYDPEYNRSRFAEPYTAGQFARSQYGMGGQYQSDLFNISGRGSWPREGGNIGKGPKGYKRSDERIHEEVCEALYRNLIVDASNIEVKVDDGVVTLTGTVASRYAKREVENCIENLSGIVDIHNELHLKDIDAENKLQEH
jgi:osmotically-inducible protein OsmY